MRALFYVTLFMCAAVTGCASNAKNEIHYYVPSCAPDSLPKTINEDSVLRNLECRNTQQALDIAREGAEAGSARMATLYLSILKSNNNIGAGLIYALKYAETGDEESITWLLQIVQKYKIISLTGPVSEMYLSLFEKKVPYTKSLLDEYLKYSLENAQYNGDITIPYSSKFIALTKNSLSEGEYKNALLTLEKIKLTAKTHR